MSGRARVLAHARRHSTLQASSESSQFPPKVAPGEVQLFSYYQPALVAADQPYTITATQHIETPASHGQTGDGERLKLIGTQRFNVVASEYTLEPGVVHSTYPPQGHADHSEILPHIVFNDPHLPWERYAVDNEQPDNDNLIPWMALLLFDTEDLHMTDAELTRMFPSGLANKKVPVQDSATLSVALTVADLKSADCLQPIPADMTDPIKLATQTSAIFVPGDLFVKLVSSYDSAGNTSIPPNGKPDLSRYQYLAHARNINTLNMADAGIEDQGLFSVVVCHRTGHRDLDKPKAAIVHLVSLENVADHIKPDALAKGQRVGLISLYSWTYQCLPDDQINFHDAMRKIGLQAPMAYLRAPDSVIENSKVQNAKSKLSPLLQKQMTDRLSAGYSIVRYRVRTGESTVAFMRGPFVPGPVPHPVSVSWLSQSNSGSAFQILDPVTGIMDISYSAAWNLGNVLAVGDRSFSAALLRLRTLVHKTSLAAAKAEILGKLHRTKVDVLRALPHHLNSLKEIHDGSDQGIDHGRRWLREPKVAAKPNLHFHDPTLRAAYLRHVELQTRRIASSTDAKVFNELNAPLIPDWSLVFSWILDRMYLINVPAHYLLNDPSYLPMESIRFFHIDRNWLDALIDGALRVGNHLERDDDAIRRGFKTQINTYLDTLLDESLGHLPQVPTFGFLLHSAVVAAFPSLKVTVPWHDKQDKRSEVLRLEMIEKNTLLCLLDRTPEQFTAITITQPDHQQCFRAGVKLADTLFEVEYMPLHPLPPDLSQSSRGVSTLGASKPVPDGGNTLSWTPSSNPVGFSKAYDWDTRTLIFPNFADSITEFMKMRGIKANAAMVGYELNAFLESMTINGTLPADGSGEPLPGKAGDSPNGLYIRPVTLFKIPNTALATTLSHGSQPQSPPPSEETSGYIDHAYTKHIVRAPHLAPLYRVKSIPALSTPADISNSQFKIDCFAASTGPGPVPSGLAYPIDLVFSFQPWEQIETLNLYQVVVFIPMGNDPATNILAAPYVGPGASMASNPRWIIGHSLQIRHPGTPAQQTFLVLSMVPRSQTQVVPLARNADMTHVLGEVRVTRPSSKTPELLASPIVITVVEDYRDPTSTGWVQRGQAYTSVKVYKK